MATSVKYADPTLIWDRLSQQVDKLIAAWDATEEPPELAEFVPELPAVSRHMTLVELVKVDMEYRWSHGLRKPLEDYLAEFPDLAPDGDLPCDLIYEEYQVRRQNDSNVIASEYFQRFPRQAEGLRRLFKVANDEELTTSLVGREKAPDLEVGQQIDDFDLLTRLGKGAFATVFLARQRSMQRLVALKVSRDRGSEPQTLAQLDHPYIVRVYDQRTVTDRGLRLMYMQNIAGGTLHLVVDRVKRTPVHLRTGRLILEVIDEVLAEKGDASPSESSLRRRLTAMSWPEAVCWLGSRLAQALHYAHGIGVLHRDVKPANVLLCPDGSPKLADFNVSFSSKLDGATPAAYFGGSLAYMSPEQLEASDVDNAREASEMDGRSDVYSLAVMMWELLTGARPFNDEMLPTWGGTLKALAARRHAGVDLETVERLPADSPPALEDILLRCLSPNPDDRPANAAAFARELEVCLQPQAQRLMRPRSGSLSDWARRWPIWAFVILGVTPSALLSPFSIFYNQNMIVDWLGETPPRQVQQTLPEGDGTVNNNAIKDYWQQVMIPVVNAIVFPLGATLGVVLCWPVVRALRFPRLMVGREPFLRKRTLVVGDGISLIALALWAATGIAFAVWLNAIVPENDKTQSVLLHFFTSQLLCGLIASTQTFFYVTFLTVRSFYPSLIARGGGSRDDLPPLERLLRRTWFEFFLAVATPFVGFLLLNLLPELPKVGPGSEGGTSFRQAMIFLSLIGLVGSAIAYQLLRTIQRDIYALAAAIDPDKQSFGGDGTDSFWAGSR